MFRTKLTIVISSVLLAASAAQAQSAATEQSAAAAPAPTSVPATTAPQDAGTDTQGNDKVGSPDSNVDKQSTSGAYYPYSSGTVGDDPSEPRTTSTSAGATEGTTTASDGSTDQWKNADTDSDGYLSQDELTKVAPALADNFDAIDVDGDEKLTRGEFRTWHESQKARMDADQGSSPATSPSASEAPASEAPASQAPASTQPGTVTSDDATQ